KLCRMTDVEPRERNYNVAFYQNRNHMRVDRELTFTYELQEDIGWQPREEVVLPAEVNAYEGLCKLAVGTISRIVYLPRETNFDRALLSREGVIRPTGATINIRGNNFRGMFGLRDQDFSSDGLAFNGT